MVTLHRESIVPYNSKQMYDLVNDVDSYPLFLPWCHTTSIVSQTDEEMVATIEVMVKHVRKSFTTRNLLSRFNRIDMSLVEGPFSDFSATWQFDDLKEGACRISFDIEFDFSSKLVAMLFSKVFVKASEKMVESFCSRADQLYGDNK